MASARRRTYGTICHDATTARPRDRATAALSNLVRDSVGDETDTSDNASQTVFTPSSLRSSTASSEINDRDEIATEQSTVVSSGFCLGLQEPMPGKHVIAFTVPVPPYVVKSAAKAKVLFSTISAEVMMMTSKVIWLCKRERQDLALVGMVLCLHAFWLSIILSMSQLSALDRVVSVLILTLCPVIAGAVMLDIYDKQRAFQVAQESPVKA